jgi:hypothetical protein
LLGLCIQVCLLWFPSIMSVTYGIWTL